MVNTTELKELAEAASLTGAQLVDMSVFEFAESQRLKQQFCKIRPEAILKLLEINAELVEALKKISSIEIKELGIDWGEVEEAQDIARAALAKAEGGEL